MTDIKVGNRLLSHSAYRKTNSNDTQLSYTEYGNGDKIYYVFDALDRVIAERTGANTEPYVSYDYNSEGLVGRVTDNLAGNVTEYKYDLLGRLVSSNRSDGSIDRYFYSYDESNNLTEIDAYLRPYNAWRLQCRYYYGADNLQTISEQGNYLIYYYYDDLNRIISTKAVEVTDGAEFYTIYSYLGDSNTGNSTSFVSKVTYRHRPSGGSLSTVGTIDYTYDKNGFISSVTTKNASGTVLSSESYTYDALGQIKTVTRGSSVTEYTYDNAGNILTKKVNGTVVGSYTYSDSNWKDLLTAYNGTSITYDGIGNPTSYIGWNNLTWSMGRRLTALSNDTDSITYNYDAAGQRVSKTVNGTKTEFYYDDRGSLILSKTGNTEIYFYPDADGSIGSINYLGNRYYYVRNAQNDIIGITDKTGSFVVKYTYDEWGNITSITDGNGNDVSANASHIANLNPLRYRSYFYDTETGFYWLNTRYYNPEVGRFLNADGLLSTGQGILGHNMFAYCGNNPVIFADSTGELVAVTIMGVTIGAKAFFGFLGVAATAVAASAYTASPAGQRAIGGIASTIHETFQQAMDSISDIITAEREKSIATSVADTATSVKEDTKKRAPIVIYRYGGTSPSNLTPSKNDVKLFPITGKGLSFSLTPKPGAAKTTIEAINATGVLYAVVDGLNHVSVFPIGGTLKEWRDAGSSSVWTKVLKSVVIKYYGG